MGLFSSLKLITDTSVIIDLKYHIQLKDQLLEKYPLAAHITVDILEPEQGKIVYDILIYDEKIDLIGGAEVTETETVWDD